MKRFGFSLFLLCLFNLPAQTNLWNQYPEGPWVIQTHLEPGPLLQLLASEFDLWNYEREKNEATLQVTPAELKRILALGLDYQLDIPNSTELHLPRSERRGALAIPNFPCYDTVEGTATRMDAWIQNFPSLVEKVDIGDSWQKQQNANGYDLLVYKLTNQNISGTKAKLFILSGLHARELAPVGLATAFADDLLSHYGSAAYATWLLDHVEIHLLFQGNPDGRKQAETGDFWRKNNDTTFCPVSLPGVDLNRNFSFMWGCCNGASNSPCDETYRGPAAGSEPESAAIMNYLTSIFPDQRGPNLSDPAPDDATGVFIDIHSYGGYVLWPYGFNSTTPTPNVAQLQRLGRKFAFFNSYSPEIASLSFVTDGVTDDFNYGTFGVAAYTFEIGTTFFQSCSSFENTILPANLPALFYAASVAHAPYLLPLGPDILDLNDALGPVTEGQTILVNATADDTRFSTRNSDGSNPPESAQNIVAAGFWLSPPWDAQESPLGWATAVDGAFDATTEAIAFEIDTHGFSGGPHLLYFAAKDADGNWGPPAAIQLEIIANANFAHLSGQVREALTLAPLDGELQISDYHIPVINGQYSTALPADAYTLYLQSEGYRTEVMSLQLQQNEEKSLDFLLVPECDLFNNDFEAGSAGWSSDGSWVLTHDAAYGGDYGWGFVTGSSQPAYLTSPLFDIQNLTSLDFLYSVKSFFHSQSDHIELFYSFDDLNWTYLASIYDAASWTEKEAHIPDISGHSQIRLRFEIQFDPDISSAYFDSFRLFASGPACYPPNAYLNMLPNWPSAVKLLDLVPFSGL